MPDVLIQKSPRKLAIRSYGVTSALEKAGMGEYAKQGTLGPRLGIQPK